MPKLVSTDEKGMKSLNTTGVVPILAQAIQDINLKITDINNLDTTNSWRDSLIAWFGNIENGITSIFAKEVNTENLCVSDSSGSKTCITKAQLDSLLSGSVSGSSSGGVSTPDPIPNPPSPEEDGDSEPNPEETPEPEPTTEPTPEEEVVETPISTPEPESEIISEPEPEPTPEPAPEPSATE